MQKKPEGVSAREGKEAGENLILRGNPYISRIIIAISDITLSPEESLCQVRKMEF